MSKLSIQAKDLGPFSEMILSLKQDHEENQYYENCQ